MVRLFGGSVGGSSNSKSTLSDRCNEKWMKPEDREYCMNKLPTDEEWNGNLTTHYFSQDGVCSFPAGWLNYCPAAGCCKKHDACYAANQCNEESWKKTVADFGMIIIPFPSPRCDECNHEVLVCVWNLGQSNNYRRPFDDK